ncbi:MAG: HAD family hydrolase [Candidatus Methanomethylicia archaeon]
MVIIKFLSSIIFIDFMVKLVIFDLDQTLIDTIHRFHEVFNLTLTYFGGSPVSWDLFIRNYSNDTLDTLIPTNCDKNVFWNLFRKSYCSFIHELDKPIDGVYEVLNWLKGLGVKIIVCTGRGCSRMDIIRELTYFSLIDFIDGVYSLCDQDPSEEDVLFDRSGLLRRILSDFNLEPSDVIFVGDYWVDMYSAKKVGITAIGVLTGHEPEWRLLKFGADHIINSIVKLPEILSKIKG